MSLKFKTPPLNELVIGVYFDLEIPSLRSEHIGLFWGQIRDEFPTISQQVPVSPPYPNFTSMLMGLEFYPMPRYWLETADGSALMQIQKNAFLFDWRKRAADYPHFETLKATFDKNLQRFLAFISKELNEPVPTIRLAELAYINIIESCEYWRDQRDTAKIIPQFRLPTPVLFEDDDPAEFQQTTGQKLSPDLMLTTTVRSARSTVEPNAPVPVLEYRATGLLTDAAAVNRWFGRAHDAIGHCFTEMTNPDIQKRYWQPV